MDEPVPPSSAGRSALLYTTKAIMPMLDYATSPYHCQQMPARGNVSISVEMPSSEPVIPAHFWREFTPPATVTSAECMPALVYPHSGGGGQSPFILRSHKLRPNPNSHRNARTVLQGAENTSDGYNDDPDQGRIKTQFQRSAPGRSLPRPAPNHHPDPPGSRELRPGRRGSGNCRIDSAARPPSRARLLPCAS